MLPSYAGAAVLCLLSASVGLALYRLLRIPPGWAAPATGLALVVAIVPVAIQLPGNGITAAAVLAVLAIASLPFALRGKTRHALEVVPVSAAVAGACALPFAANWRFGALGAGFNFDLGPHLAWADALRRGDDAVAIIPGYPVGAHALAGGLAALFRTDALAPFTGLMIAVVVLMAVTAFGALADLSRPRRLLAAGVVALPFLVAGQYAQQAAFKELFMALFVLASALTFVEARRDGDTRLRRAVPVGVIAGGSVSVYGAPAAYYAVALLGAWAVAELATRRGSRPLRRMPELAAATGIAVATAAVLVLPQLPRLRELSAVDVAGEGNIQEHISRLALLGFWPSVDLRFPPPDEVTRWTIGIFVVAVLLYSTLWWVRRRELLIPGIAVAVVAIHAASEFRGTPYISAKTLAIASPVMMLLCCRPLLAGVESHRRRPLVALALGLVATVFLTGAAWSSGVVLRHGAVGPIDRARDLAELREDVAGEPTLFLGQSFFAMWELQGAKLSSPVLYAIPSQVPFQLREGKPVGAGAAVDFDTIDPRSLDSFRYVVTPLSAFSSIPPPNWTRERTTRDYVLWARNGLTPPREILDEGQFPGAQLDCGDDSVSGTSAEALVRPAPVVAPSAGWRTSSGSPAPFFDTFGYAAVLPGDFLQQTVDLPPGRWELALQYASPRPLEIEAERISTTLSPMLDPRGDFWRIGTLVSSGEATTVSVTPAQAPIPLADVTRHQAVLGMLVATNLGEVATRMPLQEACGRYVDAYTPG